nr:unnamed protein product [Spirometra erinaceieuropaei]
MTLLWVTKEYADRNEWKALLSSSAPTEVPYSPRRQIQQRWTEHFRGVLNRPSTISDAAIARLSQAETNVDLILPPSLHETIRTVQQLSSGKAPRSEAIAVEIYKYCGPQLMDHLAALFQEMWRQGGVPQDFKEATIVHLYKRKGNHQLCDNHRDISLLNIVGKIFARVLLNRLNNHLEQGLPPPSWDHRHSLRHQPTSEEVPIDADPPMLYLRGSGENLRHGESRRIGKSCRNSAVPSNPLGWLFSSVMAWRRAAHFQR